MAVGLLLILIGLLFKIKVTPYAKYTNTALGFSIKFPSYWKPVPKPQAGAVIVFISPKESALDELQENFSVSIKDMPNPMTIEHVSNLIVNQVGGTFGETVDISQMIPATIGGKPGYRLQFAGKSKMLLAGGVRDVANPVLYLTAWTIVGNRLYILTFTGAEKDFAKFEKKANEMISSFKFLPAPQ